jgi:excisionase family DNA binding protein
MTLEREHPYLTIDQLHHRSGISKPTLYRWVDRNVIPFYQPGGKGGKLLFPPNAIELATRDRLANGHAEPVAPKKTKLSGPRPKWEQVTNLN